MEYTLLTVVVASTMCSYSLIWAIWFSNCRGLRLHIDSQAFPSTKDLVTLILNPSGHLQNQHISKEKFTLTSTLIVESIWSMRNKLLFQVKKINLMVQSTEIQRKFTEVQNCQGYGKMAHLPVRQKQWQQRDCTKTLSLTQRDCRDPKLLKTMYNCIQLL